MTPLATTSLVLIAAGMWLSLIVLAITAARVWQVARAIESLANRAQVELLAHQARRALEGVQRTAEAVEILAYQANETISGARGAAVLLNDFASNVKTGWLRAVGLALGAVTTLWPGRHGSDDSSGRAANASR